MDLHLHKVHIPVFKLCLTLSTLTAIFLREPGLAGFIEAKDDGSVSDNWCYKSRKALVKFSPPTNQHPTFYVPNALPVAQPTCQSTEGKTANHKMYMTAKTLNPQNGGHVFRKLCDPKLKNKIPNQIHNLISLCTSEECDHILTDVQLHT